MPRLTKLSRSIAGSVAIVTGAASGMGRATAQLFADEGARLAIIDINDSALQSVAEELESVGTEVIAMSVDLRDRGAVVDAITKTGKHFGSIDILVNNAGFAMLEDIEGAEFGNAWDDSVAVMATA